MARKPSQGNALQELKTALKNKELGRLYFFHGEETFLLNHYLVQMKNPVHMDYAVAADKTYRVADIFDKDVLRQAIPQVQ